MKIAKVFQCLAILGLVSCLPQSRLKNNACEENIAFKTTFFHHIAIIETYNQEHNQTGDYTITPDSMMKSMSYISHYTPVALGEVLGYEIGYPNDKMFERDKARWLRWYHINKCRNLQ